jgi:membrane fusion protein, multidrug efflux system
MKNIFYLFIITSVIASCSSGNGTDKKTELAKLKKEAATLQDKIKAIEEELSSNDTTAVDLKEVAVTEMKPQLFEHYIEVQAKIDGDENVAVSSEMMGKVIKVNVNPGDKVSKGTILAELDAAAIQKGIEEAENQYDFLNTVYLKQKSLWDQKVGSEIQYLSAKNNYESAAKRIATLREQLAMSKIKSPINGTVDAVDLKVGQAISPGMPAIRVVNMSNLKVKGEVAEAYISKVNTGNEVVIVFPDLKREIKSKLTYSGKVIDNLNRTFKVEAAISSTEKDLHPNMVAVLKIVDYKSNNAFSVPVNLIQYSDEGSFIYVAETIDNKQIVKKRIVKTGQTYNGLVEVTEGIKERDLVITTGYQDLLENETVKL